MRWLKEQITDLGTFFSGPDYRRSLFICVLALTLGVGMGCIVVGIAPDTVEQFMATFMEQAQAAGVVGTGGELYVFALLANNWTAMLTAILYGLLPFLFLPALAVGANGAMIGMLGAWYAAAGIPLSAFFAGILPHGIFELTALVLAAACGVTLCQNMGRMIIGSPRRAPLVELLSSLLRVLLLLVMPLTACAAFVECYITPIVMGYFLAGSPTG